MGPAVNKKMPHVCITDFILNILANIQKNVKTDAKHIINDLI